MKSRLTTLYPAPIWLLFAALPCILLLSTGCGETAQANQLKVPEKQKSQPVPANDPNIVIDWVNFIRFNGITYIYTGMGDPASAPLVSPDMLGKVYDTVKFQVADNIKYEGYETKDGDAAFINPGTKVYEVNGYSPSFRLAVISEGQKIMLFEADTNPQARKGADLLDLAGKVQAIKLKSTTDGTTQLGLITDPATINQMVNTIMQASVDQNHSATTDLLYLVEFQFQDKTSSTRPYWDGVLGRGILVPAAFTQTLAKAVKK